MDQSLLTTEQMGDSSDVESEPVAIGLDQRRPASRPARQPLQQSGVAVGIGGDRDQRRVERTRIGEARTGPSAARGGGFRHRMDDRSVSALDSEDDRPIIFLSKSVRR
jgi:hypothetical protein